MAEVIGSVFVLGILFLMGAALVLFITFRWFFLAWEGLSIVKLIVRCVTGVFRIKHNKK